MLLDPSTLPKPQWFGMIGSFGGGADGFVPSFCAKSGTFLPDPRLCKHFSFRRLLLTSVEHQDRYPPFKGNRHRTVDGVLPWCYIGITLVQRVLREQRSDSRGSRSYPYLCLSREETVERHKCGTSKAERRELREPVKPMPIPMESTSN